MTAQRLFSSIARAILFGNHFYAICAVALSVEASVQQQLPLNDGWFYVLLYLSVVIYYNQAYLFTDSSAATLNPRSEWYYRYRNTLRTLQLAYIIAAAAVATVIFLRLYSSLLSMYSYEWALLFAFPIASAAYYGIDFRKRRLTLRNAGLAKPFIIGLSWAGLVTVYPALYHAVSTGTHYHPNLIAVLLTIKNMMFVAVLCIMFDVKDYAMDYNFRLKTFVVKLGLRKTIFLVIMPLCVAGLISFVSYALWRGFHPARIALNVVPFLAAVAVAYSLHLRRRIFYYLVIIDGLMLLKAACGIVAMQFR